jgi:hypothetical protein
VDSKPLSRHPCNALGRRRIKIRENHEIVTSRETSFDDSIDPAGATRDSEARGKSAWNTMVSQGLQKFE